MVYIHRTENFGQPRWGEDYMGYWRDHGSQMVYVYHKETPEQVFEELQEKTAEVYPELQNLTFSDLRQGPTWDRQSTQWFYEDAADKEWSDRQYQNAQWSGNHRTAFGKLVQKNAIAKKMKSTVHAMGESEKPAPSIETTQNSEHMELQLTNAKVLEVKETSGVSAAGNQWTKQDVILEVEDGSYTKQLHFEVFGDAIDRTEIEEGETLAAVYFDIRSRQWQDKWFDSFSIWKVEHAVAPAAKEPSFEEVAQASQIKEESSLPF